MDKYFNTPAPQQGGLLSRQMSVSYNVQNSRIDYQDFFRRNTNKEEGWLLARHNIHDQWVRRWFIFEDSVLRYGPSQTADFSEFIVIPMDKVVSIRTDNAFGKNAFRLTTTDNKLYLQADTADKQRNWLFLFQKSVALVLSHIMATTKPADLLNPKQLLLSPTGTGSNSGKQSVTNAVAPAQVWLNELGYGHGKHSFLVNKRRSSFTKAANGADESNDVATAIPVLNTVQSEFEQETIQPRTAANRTLSHDHIFNSPGITGVDFASRASAFSIAPGARTSPSGLGLGLGLGLTQSGIGASLSAAAAASISESTISTNTDVSSLTLTEKFIDISSHVGHSQELDSFWDRPAGDRSHINLAEMYSGESGEVRSNLTQSGYLHGGNGTACGSYSSNMSGIGLSLSLQNVSSLQHSVAIPISGTVFDNHTTIHGHEKVAGSFKDSTASFLNNAEVNYRVGHDGVDEYDGSPRVLADVDSEVGSEEMFEMEDNSATRAARGPSFDSKSLQSSSHRAPLSFTAALGLAKPSDAKLADGNMRWLSGYCTKLGPRSSNEDRLIAIPDLREEMEILGAGHGHGQSSASHASSSSSSSSSHQSSLCGYFAVYDGHSGSQGSTYVERELHGSLYNHPLFTSDLLTAITETCKKIDKDFVELCRQQRWACGTTALGSIVRDGKLVVFNIGDCQAVLCSNGVARNVCLAHKPGRDDERERVMKANGWITEESELFFARLHIMDLSDPDIRDKANGITFVKIHRVCGELAVSRSIGDCDYKNFVPGETVLSSFMWPDDHNQIFYADPVIPDPEFVVVDLTTHDEFVILASDGLWDVVSEQDAVNTTRVAINKGVSMSHAAEELCDLALRMGSSDNVTVVIVRFVHR